MAPIMTAEDVVQRIAAERAYIDACGVGTRLKPAAATCVSVGSNSTGR
jgi:hypothetical protein